MSEGPSARISEGEARFDRIRRRVGLVAAPLAFALILFLPMPALGIAAHRMAAVAVLTIILWVTEAIPLAAAALLGPALAVLLGVAPAKEALAGFAHPLIFLFLGGFMLARALSVQGFDRRATLWLLSRGFIRGSPARAMVAVASVAFGFSMWISNTATTAMMVPIAVGLVDTLARIAGDGEDTRAGIERWGEGLLIVLAYAATLGGTTTPIGTAPNMIAIRELSARTDLQLDFLQWMAFAFPIGLLALVGMLALALRRFRAPVDRVEGLTDHVRRDLEALGPIRSGERRVLMVFALAIAGWLTPAVLRLTLGDDAGLTQWARAGLGEGIVAIIAASFLFLIPQGPGTDGIDEHLPRPLLTWPEATQIDWGTLFLLGGGFALSSLAFDTGLAAAIADSVLGDGQSLPGGGVLLLVLSTVLVIYLTEVASNTATTNMMLPVIIPIALHAGISPVPVTLTVALAASFAFMLPVSTPPNAIAYGTGRIRIGTMVRFGAGLDVGGLALMLLAGLAFLPWFFGV